MRQTNSQQNDYVALEIAYKVSQASSVWVFSLIYLLLGISILSASWMFWYDDDFRSKSHSILGVVLVAVGFIAFIIEISVFFNPTSDSLRVLFGVATLFWGVILLPAWLIYLGFRMGRYVSKNAAEIARVTSNSKASISGPTISPLSPM